MKRSFFFILLAVYLVYPQSLCYCKDDRTFDFGKIKEGKVVRHSFTLTNDTAKVLKIASVESSCGCTASQAKKDILLPGEKTLIEVKFNTEGYSGPVTQYVYVDTDNLDNPVVKFIIKAEVVKK